MRMADMTSTDIVKSLLVKHPSPEWASFTELATGTGAFSRNYIDFWTMSCYPSKGFRTVAYEIKCSRGDFMREIDNPKKREMAVELSSECYFVVPHGLIKPEEVPEPWGLCYVNKSGQTVRKQVAKQRKFEPDIMFMAAVARKASEATVLRRQALLKFDGNDVTPENFESIIDEAARKKAETNAWKYKQEIAEEVRKEVMSSDEVVAFQQLIKRAKDLDCVNWGDRRLEIIEKLFESVNLAAGKDKVTSELRCVIKRAEECISLLEGKV